MKNFSIVKTSVTRSMGQLGSNSSTFAFGSIAAFCVATILGVAPVQAQYRAWGNNGQAQLGTGTTNSPQQSPNLVALSNVTQISGGLSHGLALEGDGTVAAWGSDLQGQLGNGFLLGSQVSPVSVGSALSVLDNTVAVSAGDFHSLALKSDGTVWAWGDNTFGQTNVDDTGLSVLLPIQVGQSATTLTNIIAIDAGAFHNLALKSDGTVVAWGRNGFGQIGNGTSGLINAMPTQVAGLTNVVAIAAGFRQSMALKSDGTVWVWGDNTNGAIGNGTTGGLMTAPMKADIANVVQITAGANHCVAVKSDGTVWAWGFGLNGQIGDGSFNDRNVPTRVSGLSNVTFATSAGDHTLARRRDGSVFAWGYNANGELGNNTTNTIAPFGVSTPVQSDVNAGNIVIGAGRFSSFSARSSYTAGVGIGGRIRGEHLTITLSGITANVDLDAVAIDPTTTGLTVPAGFAVAPFIQGYDIDPFLGVTILGDKEVCLDLPTALSETEFNKHILLHGEGSALVDRTTSRNYQTRQICGITTSFSPFVVGRPAVTTAAGIEIAGKVRTASGKPLSGANVKLVSASGDFKTARTNAFGNYKINGINSGETYILNVQSKRFQFAEQVVFANEDMNDVNFVALP
ncbi:MAG: carboxypeptidase regulatory-like domain-containing protein [Pyrinomonadaceae bacterium]|nr:carboxypeptidase regulatory-like domain-containing protein [Pyrinomonadaceae bacterium]